MSHNTEIIDSRKIPELFRDKQVFIDTDALIDLSENTDLLNKLRIISEGYIDIFRIDPVVKHEFLTESNVQTYKAKKLLIESKLFNDEPATPEMFKKRLDSARTLKILYKTQGNCGEKASFADVIIAATVMTHHQYGIIMTRNYSDYPYPFFTIDAVVTFLDKQNQPKHIYFLKPNRETFDQIYKKTLEG